MDTNIDTKTYNEEKSVYIKVLIGLLVLTAITFVQPYTFLPEHNFGLQMFIGFLKAMLIVMYYMHLKGDSLLSIIVVFSLSLVAFFFLVVIIDVNFFQFADESYITTGGTQLHHSVE